MLLFIHKYAYKWQKQKLCSNKQTKNKLKKKKENWFLSNLDSHVLFKLLLYNIPQGKVKYSNEIYQVKWTAMRQSISLIDPPVHFS